MAETAKCKYCGVGLQKKTNEQPRCNVDKGGVVRVIEPHEMIKYTYYECACGARFTTKEIENRG